MTNYLDVTVTELTTLPLSAVSYLWEFISKDDKQKSYFILSGYSSTRGFDGFVFRESSTGNTLTAGDYSYNIYEQPITLSGNTNPVLTTSKVETGLLLVSGATPFTYVKDDSNDLTYKFG